MPILRGLLQRVLHPRMSRAAKATTRFLLVVGGLVSFGISFIIQMREHGLGAWTAMGLLLICTAALFYDPENPPNQTAYPGEEDTLRSRRSDDD